MDQQARKEKVARAAIEFVEDGMLLGVGTGSTVNCFIDALAEARIRLDAAVSSSTATSALLEKHGYRVIDLNESGGLALYVDGADESNRNRELIKGGGGALTREKIVAAASDRFVCIVDDSKVVDTLGRFPLPVEVIPMARSFVAREIVKIGGRPVWRTHFVTDNGNQILDVHDLEIDSPVELERTLNQVAGVVCVGLFAIRPADTVLVAGVSEIERI